MLGGKPLEGAGDPEAQGELAALRPAIGEATPAFSRAAYCRLRGAYERDTHSRNSRARTGARGDFVRDPCLGPGPGAARCPRGCVLDFGKHEGN